jgi:phosphoribosylformylglycinamidine synthase
MLSRAIIGLSLSEAEKVIPMTEGSGRPRVALIQFPGSNCEWETKRAAEAAGMDCEIFRWNRPAEGLVAYDGYLIGGGFSYQDRVRSGVIATKEPIVGTLFDQVTQEGKPVLGICNGAQVLVEAGLVPGLRPGEVEMALAPNRPNPRERLGAFICRWVYLKHTAGPGRCALTGDMPEGYVWPVPIAHGEGRFTTRQSDLLEQLQSNDQIVFQYCDAAGRIDMDPAVNPNGALAGIAGLCNPEGNVLAMMPHPERASFLRQIPYELKDAWSAQRLAAWGNAAAMLQPGPGRLIFDSLRDALLKRVAV